MITRRDFLNGVSLTIAAGLAPIDLAAASAQVPGVVGHDYYPPTLTGLRGSHPGSFEFAHALAREGKAFDFSTPVEEDYDLVIVGGGISGLSAAFFFRQQHGDDKKILVLDNHDDFGGHAKRNEFNVSGRMVLGYGGTESMESPRTGYSEVGKKLLKDLAIDIDRFSTAFDRKFYHDHKLSRAVFFDKDNWGMDKLVTGDPFWMADDDQLPELLNARTMKEFIADFPLSDGDKVALLKFHETPGDYLKGKNVEEKKRYLSKTSYRDFLLKDAKLSEQAAKYFQGRFNDLYASSSDTVSALSAMETGFPGFRGLGLQDAEAEQADDSDPYICHFPDGNASIARLLVRSLVPDVAPGSTMEDVITTRFDYSALDRSGQPVRIRLNSIGLNVTNTKDGVHVTYASAGKLHKVRGKKTILAGWNMLIPFIFPELPDEQKDALRRNVKKPLVYTNVILRNWRSFADCQAHDIYSPTMPYARVKLDYPVSLGDYRFSAGPEEPICVHMYRAVTVPNEGYDDRTQSQLGRQTLLETPFEEMERVVRDQLTRQLAGTGFDDERDIAALTVNRWPHGYSYGENLLFEESAEMEATIALARRPCGDVAIANADSGWEALTQMAIDQAWRAVGEIA